MPVPTDSDCIFCKIVAGAIPCHRLYEDEHVLSFLDIGPLSKGHTLIIPKGHWVQVDAVPDDVAASIGRIIPRLSRAIIAATGATAWNVLQNNGAAAHQVVQHVHFHIIPKFDNAGLGIDWPADALGNDEAAKLKQAIGEKL